MTNRLTFSPHPLVALFLLTALGLDAEPRSVNSRSAEPREHHLFVGAELFVRQGEDLVTVERIKGDSARLQSEIPEYVPLRKTSGLHWRLVTKVSGVKAEIENFDTDPFSSQELRDFAEQASTQSYLDGQQNMMSAAQGQMLERGAELSGAAQSDDPAIRGPAEQELASLEVEMADLNDSMSAIENIMETTQMGELSGGGAGYPPDALEVSFKISSPTPIADAYVFISIRVEREGKISDTSFYRHLSNIGPKPRKVRFTRDGFPTGFEVLGTKVYLFSYGEEIATNLSEKHYQLTYEEAKEFLHLSHIGENRRETVPAKPAWSLAPKHLLAEKNHQSFDFPLRIDLDASGQVVSISDDGSIVPEHLRELIEELTFFPALENGTPVASSLVINPADFYKN
ncbi:MAG: hypothetical protein HOH58_16215 [Opitutaceae bacterium]|nr:hypothetical protein [Opitutaceae bacterium]